LLRSNSLRFGLTLAALGAAGCGPGTAAGGPGGLSFDPCAPVALVPDAASTPGEQEGVAVAVALWNQAAATRLGVGPSDAVEVPVHFQTAAAPDHGLYDAARGQIYINDDLSGPPLAITVAHEIGHAFGLVHVDPAIRASVMNAGNQTTPPTPADAGQLSALWGACPPLDPAPTR
jgi:hypothetical protein